MPSKLLERPAFKSSTDGQNGYKKRELHPISTAADRQITSKMRSQFDCAKGFWYLAIISNTLILRLTKDFIAGH
jgi:hypothetical protein